MSIVTTISCEEESLGWAPAMSCQGIPLYQIQFQTVSGKARLSCQESSGGSRACKHEQSAERTCFGTLSSTAGGGTGNINQKELWHFSLFDCVDFCVH